MFTALIILHVLVAFIMVGVILLQSGKGAEIGAAFGGSSQTVFGARGATTLLGKLTAVTATLYMLATLTLLFMPTQPDEPAPLFTVNPPASPPPAPSTTT